MPNKKHPEYQYLDLARDILKNGVKNVDRGTGSVSFSVFGRQIRFDLSDGFPLLTTKKVYWKGVLYELAWFLSGQSNIKYLIDHDVHIWDDYPYKIYAKLAKEKKVPELSQVDFIAKISTNSNFAKKYGNLPKIYGELWRRWPTRTKRTIDQVKWLISEIGDDPDARNLIVSSWNPESLYTMAEHTDASRFPICHNMYHVSVKDKKLSLHLYQRSCDLFLGVPFNIASYSLLTIILAKATGYKPGEFIHTYGDVHIYENHVKQMREQIRRKPKPFPTVRIKGAIEDIDDFCPEQAVLEGYDPWPVLKGELTVAGGLFEGKIDNKERSKHGFKRR